MFVVAFLAVLAAFGTSNIDRNREKGRKTPKIKDDCPNIDNQEIRSEVIINSCLDAKITGAKWAYNNVLGNDKNLLTDKTDGGKLTLESCTFSFPILSAGISVISLTNIANFTMTGSTIENVQHDDNYYTITCKSTKSDNSVIFRNNKFLEIKKSNAGSSKSILFFELRDSNFEFTGDSYQNCYSTGNNIHFALNEILYRKQKITFTDCRFESINSEAGSLIGIEDIPITFGNAQKTMKDESDPDLIINGCQVIGCNIANAIILPNTNINTIKIGKSEKSRNIIETSIFQYFLNIDKSSSTIISDLDYKQATQFIKNTARTGALSLIDISFNDISKILNTIRASNIYLEKLNFIDVNEGTSTILVTSKFQVFDCQFSDFQETWAITAANIDIQKTSFIGNMTKAFEMNTQSLNIMDCSSYNSQIVKITSNDINTINIEGIDCFVDSINDITVISIDNERKDGEIIIKNSIFTLNNGLAVYIKSLNPKVIGISNCIFNGTRITGYDISLYGYFVLSGNTFDNSTTPRINAERGEITFDLVSPNCIMYPFKDSITGISSIIDSNGKKITMWTQQNNLCFDETTPTQYITRPSEEDSAFISEIKIQKSENDEVKAFTSSSEIFGSEDETGSKISDIYQSENNFDDSNISSEENEINSVGTSITNINISDESWNVNESGDYFTSKIAVTSESKLPEENETIESFNSQLDQTETNGKNYLESSINGLTDSNITEIDISNESEISNLRSHEVAPPNIPTTLKQDDEGPTSIKQPIEISTTIINIIPTTIENPATSKPEVIVPTSEIDNSEQEGGGLKIDPVIITGVVVGIVVIIVIVVLCIYFCDIRKKKNKDSSSNGVGLQNIETTKKPDPIEPMPKKQEPPATSPAPSPAPAPPVNPNKPYTGGQVLTSTQGIKNVASNPFGLFNQPTQQPGAQPVTNTAANLDFDPFAPKRKPVPQQAPAPQDQAQQQQQSQFAPRPQQPQYQSTSQPFGQAAPQQPQASPAQFQFDPFAPRPKQQQQPQYQSGSQPFPTAPQQQSNLAPAPDPFSPQQRPAPAQGPFAPHPAPAPGPFAAAPASQQQFQQQRPQQPPAQANNPFLAGRQPPVNQQQQYPATNDDDHQYEYEYDEYDD